ncbi:hypothetical protein L5515_017092 [Caenorhabditis briggsae]|uniref:BTB domain-containing protein n=1 Tax=Caenorhabditis briggsae TaxID=6238 RepID=A0AAE9FDU7_CAEBR|nr:hypothetical protein L5515_017092 [Caenorhabditis briggsae]
MVAQPRSLFEEVLSPFRNKGALRKKMRKVRGRPQTSNNASTANPVNNSKVDSSAEIPQNLTNRDEDNQTVKRKLDEVMERLQSIEESVSKIPKIENDKESTERTDDKVDVSSSNSMVSKPVQKEEKRFVLKHIFNNVASFDEETNHCSVQENHFNLDSYIIVQRLDGHLAVYFHICGPKDKIKWAVETKGELKIYETFGLGKEKIRTFDESQKDVSDFVVSVRDTKFHVQKMFLAAQSPYFKASLLGNFTESKKSEITLNGIDPDDFHYFLEVLYGEDVVDESTVEGIALLADMYDAPTAMRRCESFLINESKKSLKKIIQMASRYHLENVKNKCIEKIKTMGELRSVLPANINDLDQDVMGKLLQKSISLH